MGTIVGPLEGRSVSRAEFKYLKYFTMSDVDLKITVSSVNLAQHTESAVLGFVVLFVRTCRKKLFLQLLEVWCRVSSVEVNFECRVSGSIFLNIRCRNKPCHGPYCALCFHTSKSSLGSLFGETGATSDTLLYYVHIMC